MHATDILFHGHRSLMRSVQNIEGEQWHQAGVCGVWSAKDVLAHMASYELMLGEVIGSFMGLKDSPTLDRYRSGAGGNDAEVEDRQSLSPSEVLEEYETARALVDQRARQLDPAALGRTGSLPWYGDKYDLEDYIVYVGYGHKREHAAQLNVFKDSLTG